MFCPIVNALFICKWALFVNILMFGVIVLTATGAVWGKCWINLLKTVVVLVINSQLPERQMYVKKSDYFASLLLVPDFIKLWQTLLIAITTSMPRLALFWRKRVKDFSKALIRSIFCLHSLCNKILSPWSRPP